MRPIRFTTASDGRSLAWTRSGSGPPLVKAAAWLTHLVYDAQSPVWSHYVRFLEGQFDYLRYDERGCGLSDRDPGRLDVPTWTDDLARVIEAADMPAPFVLFAMSQGTAAAVAYAVAHPERVSHLVLLGGYARGQHERGNADASRLYDAVIEIFRAGFDERNAAFRDVFARRFRPSGDPEDIKWFSDLCRRATSPEVGAALLAARGHMDVAHLLDQVRVPTLVVHAEGDAVAPVEEGRLLAQRIPGAEFAILQSENHILQADEPAWQVFQDLLIGFTRGDAAPAPADLTQRERDILRLICEAKSNKVIARELDVSEKTVRNHATNLFAKLGVSTRQEAILKMQGQVR